MDESTKQRPIPKPRRKIVIESNQEKLPYENVEIIKKSDYISRNNENENCDKLKNRNIITEINNLNIKVNNVPTPAPRKLDRKPIEQTIDDLDASSSNFHYRSENVLKKSISCSTISSTSTHSSIDADNNSGKYKTSSPGDLFKSLGATSKLLTTSISERVSAKSKSAKQKLENWGSETTKTASKKLKNVRKSLPFVQKEGKTKTIKDDNDERPTTLPPNDDMLNSIQFYSPLNCKTNNFRDLTEAQDSSEYEMPKNCKSINTPPSYDDCMTTKKSNNLSITDSDSSLSLNSSINFQRNNNVTQSMFSSIGGEKIKILNKKPLTKNKSESNLCEISSDDEYLPPPTFPAPVFQTSKIEDIYGRIKTTTYSSTESESPVHNPRIRRKNTYENHEIEKQALSTRATIDPTEFVAERIYPKIFSRQFSPLPATTNKSESWTFYDTTVTDGNCSSPEPIYANDEPVYGKLYDDKGTENLLLPSRYSRSKDYNQIAGTSNQFNGIVDILEEFDPLIASSLNSGTTNNLSILENILAEDTYGIYSSQENILADCQSLDLSDDEDNEIPNPPERNESLPVEINEPSSSKSVIIHQNLFLKQSMENLIDDSVIKPYLAKVDDFSANEFVDLSRPSPSQSNWFVQSTEESINNLNKNQQINAVNRNDSIKSIDKVVKRVPKLPQKTSNDPPSYHEAVGGTSNVKLRAPPQLPIDLKTSESSSPPTIQTKRSKSMFSNVLNKMEGMNFNLRRKNSIKNDCKSDTMTVLEMIAKPTISYTYISHEGHLIRLPSGVVEDILKELHSRRAMIRDKKFQTFMDNQHKVPKEHFPLEYITSIQCVVNNKFR